MRKEVERKVAKVAAAQHGAIGRSQALALCASAQWIKTKVAKGAWRAPERAVYVVSGTPSTWHQRVMIAVLAAGPGAVAAGRTAGRLHGLLQHAPSRIEVVVPGHRHPRATKTRDVSRTRTLRPCDVTIVSGIPTTSAPRTLVDLAGVLDIRRLASAFDTALTSGRTSIAAMRRYLAAGGVDNWRGIATVRRLLDDREFGVPASELEREFERLIGRAALPKPVRQTAASAIPRRSFVR